MKGSKGRSEWLGRQRYKERGGGDGEIRRGEEEMEE